MEREARLREGMRMMGMRSSAFYASWVVTYVPGQNDFGLCRWWELFEGRHVCVEKILWGLAISVCGHRGGIAAIRGTDLTPEQPLLAFRMANVPGKFEMSFLSVSLSQGWYCIWLHIGIYRVYRWQLRRINKDRSVALSEDFEIRQSRCPVALSSGWSFPPFAFPRIFSLASIAYGLVITTFFTRAKTAATVGSIIFCTTSVLILIFFTI